MTLHSVRSIGVGGNRRSTKGDLDGGVRLLDGLGKGVITVPADCRGKEDEILEPFGDVDVSSAET